MRRPNRARSSVCSSSRLLAISSLLKADADARRRDAIRGAAVRARPQGAGARRRTPTCALAALEKTAATIAIESLISLAKVNDIDHLGGGLELIGPLLMTLGAVDYRGTQFSIEHGHTSIGYYSALSALGFLPRERVIDTFRRSLDIAGHVLWVPGGTPLGSGRLGVTVPVTAGWSLGLQARITAPMRS